MAVYLLWPPEASSAASMPSVKDARSTASCAQYSTLPAKHAESIEFVRYTPRTLALYDGSQTNANEAGNKILLAINGKVFDVSSGRNFYGPNGPYGNFAGRDASRGMAKHSFALDVLTPIDQPLDTLGDLTEAERCVPSSNMTVGIWKSGYLILRGSIQLSASLSTKVTSKSTISSSTSVTPWRFVSTPYACWKHLGRRIYGVTICSIARIQHWIGGVHISFDLVRKISDYGRNIICQAPDDAGCNCHV